MKKHILFIVVATAAMLFSSCGDENNSTGQFWGETEYYDDFLFSKYESKIMKQPLALEFNDDAKRLITSDIEFEVVEKNADDKLIRAEGIRLHKNGEVCLNNILKIKTTDSEVELGIEFLSNAHKGNHTLYLNAIDMGGLDRIDYLELTNGFCVKKEDIMNPLKLGLLWTFAIIVVILAVCFIISRIVNPSTKFSKLYIDYDDGAGEQRIDMGSAYKLLCTNKKTKYSVFSKFFVGVVKVEVNDFWTHDVTIKSGTRNNVRVSGLGEFEINTDETVRKEPFTITNENGQKATITTA
jgi:hypothetical protein